MKKEIIISSKAPDYAQQGESIVVKLEGRLPAFGSIWLTVDGEEAESYSIHISPRGIASLHRHR